MTSHDTQRELHLARQPVSVHIPSEMVHSKRTAAGAFSLACDASGLEDKEIYGDPRLLIDAGYFSRMKKGHATLDADKLEAFCQVVGNKVYPEWMAYQVGCGLVQLKTDAERRAEKAEHRAEEAEKKLAWALEVLQGRTA